MNAVTSVFCDVPEPPAGAVWKMSCPPLPVPVPREPVNVQFAPAVFEVPAVTLATLVVCATGDAASAPAAQLAAAARLQIVSAAAVTELLAEMP